MESYTPMNRFALRFGFLASTALVLSACSAVGAETAPAPVAAPVDAPAPAAPRQHITQLPRVAVPSHYEVMVKPDAANLSFDGSSTAHFTVTEPTSMITMQALQLTFSGATLKAADGSSVALAIATDEANQTVTFTAPTVLQPGDYTISSTYKGVIQTQANGLFALDYKNIEGQPARALFTQFEPGDGRRFMPMWDEPAYKATFDLTAVVPSAEMAVSNMPAKSQTDNGDGTKTVVFDTSPKMSSYLLFFSLGDFERITKMQGDTEIGIVMARGKADQGQYALDASAELVGYYNDYFGMPYTLPKLDNVAAPGQSQFFGAMENWGAILTFESILLVDPALTSTRRKQQIYSTDAHEIAHQWFGNIVTMGWWDDLWLNEGFASWMETKATMHFNPEWQAELSRVGGRESAMGLDSVATTHPVIQEIRTVDQISQAFDAITYQKGEAVITMLEGFAGEDTWRTGIRTYMQKHQFGNTVTDDLWMAVEDAGADGLVEIAHDFTKKPGVPLITVESAVCQNGNLQVTFKQGEFSMDRKETTDANPQRWAVPVMAATVGNKPVRTIVRGGAGSMTVPGCGTLIVNAGQTGYYRTLYQPGMIGALTQDFGKLAPIDQLGLVSDQLALSGGQYQPLAGSLDLVDAIPLDASPTVVASGLGAMTGLYGMFEDDPARQKRIAAYVGAKYGPVLDRLGFVPRAEDTAPEANLRASLIGSLGYMGNPKVMAEANRLFAALDSDPKALDGPLRGTWLGIIATNADTATWEKLYGMAKTANSAVLQNTLYGLLGAAKDPVLAKRALDLALSGEPPATTAPGIIARVSAWHPDMAYDFVIANLDKVKAVVDGPSQSEFVANIGSGSDDPAMIGKLNAYADAHLDAAARRPVDIAIVSIQTRQKNAAKEKADAAAWMDAKGI